MNTSRSPFQNFDTKSVVTNLIIINVLIWLGSVLLQSRGGYDLVGHWGLHFWRSEEFNPLQFLAFNFLHDTHGFQHVFFNMFGLWMFGRILEQTWGPKKFLFFYLVAGIGAGVMQELVWEFQLHDFVSLMNASISSGSGSILNGSAIMAHYYAIVDYSSANVVDLMAIKSNLLDRFVTIGASGALFGILIAFAWLFPNIKMFLLFIPYPIPSRIFVGIYAVVELFFGVSGFGGGNVAHFAHLGGMIVGAMVLFIWQKRGKLY